MSVGSRLVLGAAIAIATGGSAFASPVTFTWSPSAVGLTTSPANSTIVANNFNVADFSDITVNGSTGAFTENTVLTALQFLDGGVAEALNGLQSSYSFYVTAAASGTQGPVPAEKSGLTSSGIFTSANYTFWASPNKQPTVTDTPGGTPVISGNGGAFALFSGSLIDGTVALTAPLGGGYSPTADLDLTLTACAAAGQKLSTGGTCSGDESAFFVNPLPKDLDLVIGNFSATSSVTTLTPGATTDIDIRGGGGNITFATATAIAEPASLTLLGSGLLALTLVLRRRRAWA